MELLEKAGYREFDPKASYKAGDKVYWNNRKKALAAATFGTLGMEEGLRMNGAHIDSPRLDLKPNPLFEQADIAYLKPHYYGGIRKYQWGEPLRWLCTVWLERRTARWWRSPSVKKRRRAPVLHHRPSPPPGL